MVAVALGPGGLVALVGPGAYWAGRHQAVVPFEDKSKVAEILKVALAHVLPLDSVLEELLGQGESTVGSYDLAGNNF